MNVAWMRFLDKWLGAPVCLLLTLWRKLFGLVGCRDRGEVCRPQRMLFVKLAEQGSTVLAQAALQAAIRKVGRENVFFLLFAENRPILDILGLVPPANIIEINASGLLRAVAGALAAVWRMRRAGIDAAIDLEFFARSSAALCYLSGARWRVGFHAFAGEASYRGDLMTHRLSFNPYLHTSQTFQTLVEALEQPPSSFPTFALRLPACQPLHSFVPDPAELAGLKRILRQEAGHWLGEDCFGPDAPFRLILLNANASDLVPLRRWPSERYVELARLILDHYPEVYVVFTGASGEAAAVDPLVRQVASERCLSLAGKTTLPQLLALCTLAEVLVTNDSGPAHFASLTPADVVVLFGPETPKLFAALSPRTHPLWAGLVCSPCINAFNDRKSACKNNLCMQEITVEQVFAEVCRCYHRRRALEQIPWARSA